MAKTLDFKTLREDIDSHVHALATDIKDGFLSKEDKLKLDSVEEGANRYTHPITHPASMIEEDSTHRFVRNRLIGKFNPYESKLLVVIFLFLDVF